MWKTKYREFLLPGVYNYCVLEAAVRGAEILPFGLQLVLVNNLNELAKTPE